MATILTAVVGCLLMAFIANRPVAVAPYVEQNTPSLPSGWRQWAAAGNSGAVFFADHRLGVRSWLANSVSSSLKHNFAVGIGLYETGIVTSFVAGLPVAAVAHGAKVLAAPDVPVKIGNLRDPQVVLALLCLVYYVFGLPH